MLEPPTDPVIASPPPAAPAVSAPSAPASVVAAEAPVRYRSNHQVALLGRLWPRAATFERVFWGLGALSGASVLGIARWLVPDARGIGTHEQLHLPPCGFVQVFDNVPCPSCGFTTTFALAADGRLLDAFKNQPMGFAIFLGTIVAVPILTVAAVRGVSLFEATDRWPWKRLIFAFIALWLLGWLYKWKVVMA